MFDEEFLDSLPSEPAIAAKAMCDRFLERDKQYRHEAAGVGNSDMNPLVNALAAMAPNSEYYDAYIDAAAAFSAYCEAHDLPFEAPPLGQNQLENMQAVVQYFTEAQSDLHERVTQITFEQAKTKYSAQFGGVFAYEFTDGDLARLQEAINKLRDQITQTSGLQEDHRRRLLARIEKLQSELHKRVSDLDRFWGLIGDAGVVVGKLGDDAKPIVDRIREISQIVWKTQSRSEELPSDSKPAILEDRVGDDDSI